MSKKVLVFMEYGVEQMPLTNANELPLDAVYDGTYDEFSVYVIHNNEGLQQFAVRV